MSNPDPQHWHLTYIYLRSATVNVDGHMYRASFCRFIRYQSEHQRRLNVGITEYSRIEVAAKSAVAAESAVAAKSPVAANSAAVAAESALTDATEEPPHAQMPQHFTKVELFWTQRGARDDKHHCRIDDLEVATYEPFACVKRMAKSVTVLDLTGVHVMSSIVCDRLRVAAKYRSYVFRLSRTAQNSQNQRRRARHLAAAGENAAAGAADGVKREKDAEQTAQADGNKRYGTVRYGTVRYGKVRKGKVRRYGTYHLRYVLSRKGNNAGWVCEACLLKSLPRTVK
jgi:hypothetical protein